MSVSPVTKSNYIHYRRFIEAIIDIVEKLNLLFNSLTWFFLGDFARDLITIDSLHSGTTGKLTIFPLAYTIEAIN